MNKDRMIYYVVFQNKKKESNQVEGIRLFYERLKALDAANSWTAENNDQIYTMGSAWVE